MNFNETPEQEALLNKLITEGYEWPVGLSSYIWPTASITYKQFEARDGWITAKGDGVCPIADDVPYEIMERCGEVTRYEDTASEHGSMWEDRGGPFDIVAYRLHKPVNFKNTKIRITSPEHSKAFQEAVFAAGGRWGCGSYEIQFTCKNYLYVNENLKLSYGSDEGIFNGMTYKEIFLPKGHPHAALILEFAEVAQTDPEPWKQFQSLSNNGIDYREMVEGQGFHRDVTYRRKPRTKLIHGVEVPDISFTPEDGDSYYYPDISASQLINVDNFNSDFTGEIRMADHGLCYPPTEEGREAAILHANEWSSSKTS